MATESTIQEALRAFAVLNQMLGFDLNVGKSEWGIRIESLEVAVAPVMIGNKCEAQLSLPRGGTQKVSEEIETIFEKKEAFRPICRN